MKKIKAFVFITVVFAIFSFISVKPLSHSFVSIEKTEKVVNTVTFDPSLYSTSWQLVAGDPGFYNLIVDNYWNGQWTDGSGGIIPALSVTYTVSGHKRSGPYSGNYTFTCYYQGYDNLLGHSHYQADWRDFIQTFSTVSSMVYISVTPLP